MACGGWADSITDCILNHIINEVLWIIDIARLVSEEEEKQQFNNEITNVSCFHGKLEGS